MNDTKLFSYCFFFTLAHANLSFNNHENTHLVAYNIFILNFKQLLNFRLVPGLSGFLLSTYLVYKPPCRIKIFWSKVDFHWMVLNYYSPWISYNCSKKSNKFIDMDWEITMAVSCKSIMSITRLVCYLTCTIWI